MTLCRSIWGDGEPCHEPALASWFCLSHDVTRKRLAANYPADVRDPLDLSRDDSPYVWEFIVIGEPRKRRPERHRRRARQRMRSSEGS